MKRTGGTAVRSVDIHAPWLTAGTVFLEQKIGRCARSKKLAGACAFACLAHEPAYIHKPGMRRHNDSFHDVHRCNGSDSAKGPAYIPDIGPPTPSLLSSLVRTDVLLSHRLQLVQQRWFSSHHYFSREYSSLKVFWEVGGSLMMVSVCVYVCVCILLHWTYYFRIISLIMKNTFQNSWHYSTDNKIESIIDRLREDQRY